MNIIFCHLKDDSSIAINADHIVAIIRDNGLNTSVITINEIFNVKETQLEIVGIMKAFR